MLEAGLYLIATVKGHNWGNQPLVFACSVPVSCIRLCNPMGCSPPGSSVHAIIQARILQWIDISSSGDLPNLGIKPTSHEAPALAGGFFTTEPTWEA